MEVTLELEELRRWAYAGVDRRISAMEKKRKGAHGFNRTDFWQLDIEGLCAEAALAKGLGVHFSPVTGELDTHLGDVLPGIQCRSTKYDSGCLLVHDSDSDTDAFVLVTGANGSYHVRGFIVGAEGKNPEFIREYKGRKAYWVPQSALTAPDPTLLRNWPHG